MELEEILSGKKTLIARSRNARVYKIEGNRESFVLKEFDPTLFTRAWNWFFYKSPPPLSTSAGHAHAYHKRILGNGLSRVITENAEIVDALGLTQNGFISPYIDGHIPSKDEMKAVYARTKTLEQTFEAIGMPTLSFSPRHLISRRKNFIAGKDGKLYIPDYEQSVPVPDSRGNLGYDMIYFDDVGRFIVDNRRKILDKSGSTQMTRLEESFELARKYQSQLDIRSRWSEKLIEKFSKPLSDYEINKAVEELYKEGKVTPEELEAYKTGKSGENIRLAIMNTLVHAAISIITPPVIASPISAGARLAWTIANWSYYTLTRDYDRRKIHNWRVMFVAGLPLGLFGYPLAFIPAGAYLLSIMEENPRIGLAINDNLVREFFKGMTLEEFMQGIGSKPVLKQFVIGYNAAYQGISYIPGMRIVPELVLGHNTQKAHDILLGYLMEGARR